MSATPGGRRPPASLRYRVLAAVLGGVARLLRWRLDVDGTDHVPAHGGAVVIWNHHSHLDVLLTAFVVYRATGRPCRPMALADLWTARGAGRVLRWADAIPVERDTAAGRASALRRSLTALRDGHLLLIAPEGGIHTDDELAAFRAGAARLAKRAGVPVVPTASWGSQFISTTGRSASPRSVWRAAVAVRIGTPRSLADHDDPVLVTERLRADVADLRDAARAALDRIPRR